MCLKKSPNIYGKRETFTNSNVYVDSFYLSESEFKVFEYISNLELTCNCSSKHSCHAKVADFND